MTGVKLAVLGLPIKHSRSPEIHARFARQAGIDLQYERILVPDGEFRSVAENFLVDGLGFNVTLPCKREAWQFVDVASDGANLAEAVNTVSISANGQLRGDNTDGPGLVRDLKSNLGWSLQNQRVLILGAGGAVSGVLSSILDEQPGQVHLHNRTHHKAIELVERFSSEQLRAVEFDGLGEGYDLVINGTSAGLAGEDVLLPAKVLNSDSYCYDMVYGSGVTTFNRWCREQADCHVADGLGMLVEQAAIAFEIWFNTKIDSAAVVRELRAIIK
jgi:shikimate dehydrogenase